MTLPLIPLLTPALVGVDLLVAPSPLPRVSRPYRVRAQPGLSIFVVGHTDSTGALDHNFKLSAARARAVAAALGHDFGIAAARLDAHGAGPLAPVARNTTEDGRQLNRRVELVAR